MEVIKNLRKYINSNNNVSKKDIFYKELLNSCCNKLEEIKEFIDIFKKLDNYKVNYLDFYDKLVKTGEMIYKEKVWNLFKNLNAYDNAEFIPVNSLVDFMVNNNITYNKSNLDNKDKINFEEFLLFFINEKIEFN